MKKIVDFCISKVLYFNQVKERSSSHLNFNKTTLVRLIKSRLVNPPKKSKTKKYIFLVLFSIGIQLPKKIFGIVLSFMFSFFISAEQNFLLSQKQKQDKQWKFPLLFLFYLTIPIRKISKYGIIRVSLKLIKKKVKTSSGEKNNENKIRNSNWINCSCCRSWCL